MIQIKSRIAVYEFVLQFDEEEELRQFEQRTGMTARSRATLEKEDGEAGATIATFDMPFPLPSEVETGLVCLVISFIGDQLQKGT
jgi:hypothetical protein